MRNLLPRCRQNLKINMKISSRRLDDYVKTMYQKACRTCSTTIFLHSTNQIIDLWRCRWRCSRQILNSLLRVEHGKWDVGKTRNEFATWHVVWLVERDNFAQCNICFCKCILLNYFSFISLSHSAYITSRTIIPLCRLCQMSLRKLVPPFTLTYICALPTKREENWEV